MSYIVQILGNNVRLVRERRNLKMENLAELIGLSYQSLSAIELGKGFLTAETLEKLCKALDVSPAELFSLEELPEKLNNNSDIAPLLERLIKELDEKKQASIYKIITVFLDETKP